MVFKTDSEASGSYINNWKRRMYIPCFICGCVLIFYIFYYYHKGGNYGFYTFLLMSPLVVWGGLAPVSKASKVVNLMIDSIEISDGKVELETIGFDLFGGLMRRPPIKRTFSKKDLEVTEFQSDSKFVKTYLGRVYEINKGNEKYLLGAELFENISQLLAELNFQIGL